MLVMRAKLGAFRSVTVLGGGRDGARATGSVLGLFSVTYLSM
jgi:hypothetical protein